MEHHHQHHHFGGGHHNQQGQGPTTSQVLAVVTLLPFGGFLLLLAWLTLAGTVIGLVVATPLFILFSPVLVPAALAIGLALSGFLTSGAFGITGLSSLTWIANYLMRVNATEKLEHGKQRVQEAAGTMGQRVKETGQELQSRAREGNPRT